MKLFKLTFFLAIALFVTACGDDDSSPSTCTQSDWVGTYEGTVDCDGTVEDVTVNITANGTDNIVIIYETATVETEYDPLPPDGCSLNNTGTGNGLTVTVSATLDGDDLTLNESFTDGSITSICDLTATRN